MLQCCCCLPYLVTVCSSVSIVSGVSAVGSLYAVGVPAVSCIPTVVKTPFLPVLTTLFLLAFADVPAISCVAFGPAVTVVLSAVEVEPCSG